MTTIDPVWATVAELSRAFQARTLSPVDVVDALLARIHKRDGALHSYIAVYDADARLAAEAADKAMRAASVVHIKQWVEIASQLGAPVLRVFADTQMRAKTRHDVAGPNATWNDVAVWIADG